MTLAVTALAAMPTPALMIVRRSIFLFMLIYVLLSKKLLVQQFVPTIVACWKKRQVRLRVDNSHRPRKSAWFRKSAHCRSQAGKWLISESGQERKWPEYRLLLYFSSHVGFITSMLVPPALS